MDRTRIKEILVRENYPEFMLEPTIDKIERFTPEVKAVFNEWCSRNETPEFSVEGFSYKGLVIKWRMKPVGAFITLDWLIREPEKAKAALQKGIK